MLSGRQSVEEGRRKAFETNEGTATGTGARYRGMGVDIREFLTSITLKFQQDLFAKEMVLSSCPESISTHAVLASG